MSPSDAAEDCHVTASSTSDEDDVPQGRCVASVAIIGRHRPPVRTRPTPFRSCLPPLLIVKCTPLQSITVSVHSDAFFPPHLTSFLSIHPQLISYCACHTIQDKALCGVVRSAHQPHGLRPN